MRQIEIIDKDQNSLIIIPQEISNRCRTCLINVGIVNLFSTENNDIIYRKVFTMFSLPEVTPSDGLPQKICSSCAKLFQKFCAFKERIEQLHVMLEIAIGKGNQLNNIQKPQIQQNHVLNNNEREIKSVSNNNTSQKPATQSYDSDEDEEIIYIYNDDGGDIDQQTNCNDIDTAEDEIICIYNDCDNNTKEESSQKINDIKIENMHDLNTEESNINLVQNNNKIIVKYHRNSETLDEIKENELSTTNSIKTEMNDIIMQCTLCKRSFDSYDKYYQHMQNHTGKQVRKKYCTSRSMRYDAQTGKQKCDNCNLKFNTVPEFLSHIKYISSKKKLQTVSNNSLYLTKKYPCKICGKHYNSTLLSDHMNIHTKQKPYMCDICGETFSFKANLLSHKHSKLLCDRCGQQFKCQSKLKSHIEIRHLEIKAYSCDICGKKLADKGSLHGHLKLHTGERPHLCTICGKSFIQRPHLISHVKYMHTKKRPLRCAICNRGFVEKFELTYHMKQHAENRKYRECEICEEFTKNMKMHMKLHEQGQKFICGRCHEVFKSKKDLVFHKETCIRRNLPFLTCKICGKKFKLRNDLRVHTRVHTGERPFECETCGKRFIQRQHLNNHSKLHTGEKKFECSYCSKKFALKGNLQQHILCHTGEKPFVCEICFKKFSTSSGLKKHSNVHSKSD